MQYKIFILSIAILFSSGCSLSSRPPISPGEIPVAKTPSISDEQYGQQVLNQLTRHYELDYNDARLDKITAIVERLTKAANAQADPWHVYLFKAPRVKNAAATRGNHLFFWSGMLDITQSEEEIATVVAHEIAHVLAGHTEPDPREEVYQILIGVGAMAAGIAISATVGDPSAARTVGNLSSSITKEVASGLILNPHSREREKEADHIGLFLMADAKYNPNQAIEFWRRAQKDPDFYGGIEFFSTHPLPVDRLKTLESMLPSAMERYHQAIGLSPRRRTSTDGDSFDIGESSRQINQVQQYLVKQDQTILYEKPSKNSRKIGEFRKGARVTSVKQEGNWHYILAPDKGYLLNAQLAPTQ